MFSTTKKSLNERLRFSQHNHMFHTEAKNMYEDSQFLMEPINLENNIYNKKIPHYPVNSSFRLERECTPKTQQNFYNNYFVHKSIPFAQQNYNINNNNIMLKDIKEKEKQIRIINQNYKENWKEEMKKDIKTYKYGVNLNISNYETKEAINISYDNEYNVTKGKSVDKYRKKRMKISKSFSVFDPNDLNNLRMKNSKTPQKYNNNQKNLSYDSHNFYNPNHKFSKTCSNFNQCDNWNKSRNSNYEDYNYKWKIKSFIEKLEEYFVESLKVFFCFFVHRIKLYIKISEIKNIQSISQLSDEFKLNKNKSYTTIIQNGDDNLNKTFQKRNKDYFHITNLKKANIRNTSLKIKLNDNCQKHVQFDKNSIKNKNIKNAKIEYSFPNINNISNKKSYHNSSTAFNSNEIKSTNSSSHSRINQYINNISLLKNKNNIHIFNKETVNSLSNLTLKNKNLSNEKMNDNKLTKYKSSNEIYNKKKALIYVKPKIENMKMFKIDKISNFPNNKIYSDNKIELSIKSMILKKKNISKSFKSSNKQKKIEQKSKDEFKEIIIKDIKTNDKRINISIKYIISEKYLKEFTKAKIRKKLISLNNIKNIFINNDIELLKPKAVESFDYIPVITILKVNIKDNIYDKNKEKNQKLCDIIDIIKRLSKKYIIYFGQFFFNELENANSHIKLISNDNLSEKDAEFNKINISCISNKENKNQENEIMIEENYSLNNDIDNTLLNNNEKIETEKYLFEIDHINKMISPSSSENENFLVNDNHKVDKRENIKLTDFDINQPKEKKQLEHNNNYQLDKNIIKNDENKEKTKLKLFDCDSMKKNKLFTIKISRHKICKNILKDIKIKREKIDKDKILKMKNLLSILENKINRMNFHYSELLKYNFDRWKQIISKANIEYGYLGDKCLVKNLNDEIFAENNEIIMALNYNRNKSINKNEVMEDKNSLNKYYYNFDIKVDKNNFIERIKDFRLHLIEYFAFRLKNALNYDD